MRLYTFLRTDKMMGNLLNAQKNSPDCGRTYHFTAANAALVKLRKKPVWSSDKPASAKTRARNNPVIRQQHSPDDSKGKNPGTARNLTLTHTHSTAIISSNNLVENWLVSLATEPKTSNGP